MRFFRCDRCGKEFDHKEYTVTTETLSVQRNVHLKVAFPFDLCDDCLKDFENWFRQPMVDKAFEEAHAKAHAHEKNEVTVLGLEDGRFVCPVCGEVFEMSYPSLVEPTGTFYKCPKCGVHFDYNNINYIKMNKKENKDNEQQSDAEKT